MYIFKICTIYKMTKEENTKEDFCGACIAAPLAMVGLGAAATNADLKSKKKWKKWVFIIGITVSVISIAVGIWFLTTCKTCKI
jgi:hypothetical protein